MLLVWQREPPQTGPIAKKNYEPPANAKCNHLRIQRVSGKQVVGAESSEHGEAPDTGERLGFGALSWVWARPRTGGRLQLQLFLAWELGKSLGNWHEWWVRSQSRGKRGRKGAPSRCTAHVFPRRRGVGAVSEWVQGWRREFQMTRAGSALPELKTDLQQMIKGSIIQEKIKNINLHDNNRDFGYWSKHSRRIKWKNIRPTIKVRDFTPSQRFIKQLHTETAKTYRIRMRVSHTSI